MRRTAPTLRLLLGAVLLVLGASLLTGDFVLKGLAQTGIEGSWTSVSCIEFHTWPALPSTAADQGEKLGKDVGVTDPAIVQVNGHDEIRIDVAGSYPSYGVQCDMTYTVLAVFSTIPFATMTPLNGLSDCVETTNNRIDCTELTAIFTAGQSGCVPPNTPITNRIVFHVEPGAQEAATMAFRVRQTPLQCSDPPTQPPFIGSAPVSPSGFPNFNPGPSAPNSQPDATSQSISEVQGVRSQPSDPGLVSEVAGIRVGNNGDGGLLNARPSTRHSAGAVLILTGGLLTLPWVVVGRRRLRRGTLGTEQTRLRR